MTATRAVSSSIKRLNNNIVIVEGLFSVDNSPNTFTNNTFCVDNLLVSGSLPVHNLLI